LSSCPLTAKWEFSKKINSFRRNGGSPQDRPGDPAEGFGCDHSGPLPKGAIDEALQKRSGKTSSDLAGDRKGPVQVGECTLAWCNKDMSTTSSVIRACFRTTFPAWSVDSKKLCTVRSGHISSTPLPSFSTRSNCTGTKAPIFDVYGNRERDRDDACAKVWLKSGGYIIIGAHRKRWCDRREQRAATRPRRNRNRIPCERILKAAREICRQLRLRDIGGIIVCDFIDLEDERKTRERSTRNSRRSSGRIAPKVTVLPMTEFGLVQITRQRIRQEHPAQLHGALSIVRRHGSRAVEDHDPETSSSRWVRALQKARRRNSG